MPTYEYRCTDCGESLEAKQSFTDDPLTECPACGGTLKKQFGNVGIAFKGSGFYRNDSRSAGSSSSSSSSSSSGGSSSSANGSGSSSNGSSSGKTGSSESASTSGSDSTSTPSATSDA